MSDAYRVQLDVFTGPLDLLLYLIRRDEVDIQDISITRVTEQYLEYVRVLEQLDPNAAGDFLVMASTLVELKSRALLPTPPLGAEDEDDDPRQSLVKQLLEYKRFKDAARALGSSADERGQRFVRAPGALPKELQGVELEEAQVWDLLAAFDRVMRETGRGPAYHDVTYDDIPIAEHRNYIMDVLATEGPTTFAALFDYDAPRATIVGLFLALLELIKGQQIKAEQETVGGTIYLFRTVARPEDEESGADTPAPVGPLHDAAASGNTQPDATNPPARDNVQPAPAPDDDHPNCDEPQPQHNHAESTEPKHESNRQER